MGGWGAITIENNAKSDKDEISLTRFSHSRFGFFNGTLHIGILDNLICINCAKHLTNGYLCRYNKWRYRVMCPDCRYKHKAYEKSFIRFLVASYPLQDIESEEKKEALNSRGFQ